MLRDPRATQAAYGYLPVAALKHISAADRCVVRELYGTATYYGHLRFEPPPASGSAPAGAPARTTDAAFREALGDALRQPARPA